MSEPPKSPYITAMIRFLEASPAEQQRIARELDEALARHRAKLQAQAKPRKGVETKRAPAAGSEPPA